MLFHLIMILASSLAMAGCVALLEVLYWKKVAAHTRRRPQGRE